MKPFYILGHLGLGDHLLCNAIVRHYSKICDKIILPVYQHNAFSVRRMFNDLQNIEILPVKDDKEAVQACMDQSVLRLGYYSTEGFNDRFFDREFYRQARVPFQKRWDDFKFGDGCQVKTGLTDYIVVHDDKDRGFNITREIYPHVRYYPDRSYDFFCHTDAIKGAKEVHCINSSFLILTDSLSDNPEQKLFLHHYARPTPYPTLKRNWTILC